MRGAVKKLHPAVDKALVALCLAHVRKASPAKIARLRKRLQDAKLKYGEARTCGK